MLWHFSVELSVLWGYHWDIYARNFMLPLDESQSSAGFNFIFLQFKIILHKRPVTFPLYHRVENSENIYICTCIKCCMSPSYVWIQVHIKISISFQDTVNCIILMSSWFFFLISSLHMCDMLINHRLLSLELFVGL